MIVTSSFGLWKQSALCVLGVILFSITLFLNELGKLSLAKMYFLSFAVTALSVGTFVNIRNGLFLESENMLFAVMATVMFLVDGKRKHIVYWFIFLVMISLKAMTHDFKGLPHDAHFILAMLNNFFVGGVLYLFLLVFRNILVGALERSERHEKTLTSLVDNVPIFMALVDREEKFILANQNYSERFGRSKKEIIGKKRSEVLPESILLQHQEMLNRALAGERVSFIEDNELKDGTSVSVNGQFVPILNANGQVESVTVCVDDVTELVKTQKELQSANETKDKLFSIIAHDIRSPLNLFQSILNISHDDIISKEEFLTYQEGVKEKLSSLTLTVDELLDWARMQLGGINAYPSNVNVGEVINENADLFKSLIDQKEIDFSIRVEDNLMAWIDENHLKVVVRNLVDNALKYTWKGGKVMIEASRVDDKTLLSVSDSGVGMSAHKIESIINKNLHKSEAGTEKESGTGLGLSLSLGLLEKNHCEIYVLSEVDKGTTVEVRIPIEEIAKDTE